MKLENLVLSIEQAKHLQELGLDMSDAALCWFQSIIDEKWSVTSITDGIRNVLNGYEPYVSTNIIPTYTLGEVWDKLPQEITTYYTPYSLYVDYQEMHISYSFVDREGMSSLDPKFGFTADTLLDAAYNMLCWVIENGYLEEDMTPK